jgi:hypothetical protein
VDDRVHAVEGRARAVLREIGVHELERAPIARPREVALLDGARVVLGEAVHAHHLVARL